MVLNRTNSDFHWLSSLTIASVGEQRKLRPDQCSAVHLRHTIRDNDRFYQVGH